MKPTRNAHSARRRQRSCSGLATAMLALVACSALSAVCGQPVLPATISEAMDDALFLTKFKAAVVSAGYGPALFGNDSFKGTVFAPTDAGFADDAALKNVTTLTDAPMAAGLKPIVGMHIVPDVVAFPMSTLKTGDTLQTREGHPLIIDRSVPGLIHVYGDDPIKDPTNFATILQYQQIKGGQAVLYVIDRVLRPPATGPKK